MLAALHSVIQAMESPRHISGRELTEGVRDLALDRYGPMARSVLAHWGIHATEDVGGVVFALVEQGVLVKQDEARVEDFVDVFDQLGAYERIYALQLSAKLSGTFQSAVVIAGDSTWVISDLDGDAKLDRVAQGGVYLGNGDGTFRDPIPLPAYYGVGVVAVADFDVDGVEDLLVQSFGAIPVP